MSGHRVLLLGLLLLAGCDGKSTDTGEDRVETVLALTGDASTGEALFGTECASCHGASGEGGFGPAMDTIIPSRSDEEIADATLFGAGTAMPAHEYLSDQDVADLLAFLTATFGG